MINASVGSHDAKVDFGVTMDNLKHNTAYLLDGLNVILHASLIHYCV